MKDLWLQKVKNSYEKDENESRFVGVNKVVAPTPEDQPQYRFGKFMDDLDPLARKQIPNPYGD